MIRLIGFLFLLFGITAFAQTIDAIAVIVEDEIITTYDIKKEMQGSHVDEKQAREILIRKMLEAAEIKKRGIGVSEAEVYDEIRRLSAANNMSISQFYDVVRESNGLSSSQLKEKIRERLLAQKLYQSIAMSKMSEPGREEIKEYHMLHKERFSKPSFVDVVIYSAKNKELLERKMTNPMFFSADIEQHSQRLDTAKINPQLVEMLEKTKEGHFTPVVPNGQNGFMTFYVQKIGPRNEASLEQLKPQIINAIMTDKRAQILDDYFAKLRDSADIKEVRSKK